MRTQCRRPGGCRLPEVVHAVGEHAGGNDDRPRAPVQVKNFAE